MIKYLYIVRRNNKYFHGDCRWRSFLPTPYNAYTFQERSEAQYIADNYGGTVVKCITYMEKGLERCSSNPSFYAVWGERIERYFSRDNDWSSKSGNPKSVKLYPTLEEAELSQATGSTSIHGMRHSKTRVPAIRELE